MSVWPSWLSKITTLTAATAPTLGKHVSYDAGSGALAPALPALTTTGIAAAINTGQPVRVKISKSKADTSANPVTVTCAGGDTFEGGATTLVLLTPGEKVTLSAEKISGTGTAVWVVDEHSTPRDMLDNRYTSQAALNYATKTGYHSLGSAMDESASISNAVFRIRMRVPAQTLKWRVHWRNASSKDAAYPTGTITLTGFYFGQHAPSATDGTPTGNFTAAPFQVDAGGSNVNAAEYVTGWVTDPTQQMSPDVEYLLSYGFSATGGQQMIRTGNLVCYKNGAASSANLQTISGLSTESIPGFGECWIEYQFTGANKTYLYCGDSLTDGKGAGELQNYPHAHSLPQGAVAIVCGNSGITANGYTTLGASHYAFTKWGLGTGGTGGQVTPDAAVIQLGINDILVSSRTAAQIKQDLITIIGYCRNSWGIKRIYLNTLAPCTGLTQSQEEQRILVNQWIRTKPAGISGVGDVDRELRDPTNATADVQTVTVTNATGGTYTLTGGLTATATTATIAFNATTATVQTAVRTLPGLFYAVVTGSAGAWVVTNPLSQGYIPTLTADGTLLTGTSPTATVAHTTAGALPLAAQYDSGDHLHLNADGYAKMARALPPNLAPSMAAV